MSKGPIKYSDFFDNDVKAGLAELNQLFTSIKASASSMRNVFVRDLNKAAAEVVKLQKQLEEMRTKLKQTDATTQGAAKSTVNLARETENLINKHRESKTTVNDLNMIIDVHTMGLKECRDTIKSLEREYSELNTDLKENKDRQAALLEKIKQVSTQFNRLNGDLRNAKKSVDYVDGSYTHLSKETELLKKQLQNLPDAFDRITGAINKNNKEAVDLQKQIKANTDALKEMDAQMSMHYRNVGNYSSALSSLEGAGGKILGIAGSILGFSSLEDVVRKLFETTLQLDNLDTVMKYTSVTSNEFKRNMDFLIRTSDDLGLEFLTTSNAFRIWTGAAKESNLTSTQTRWIFESVAKAASTMRMSADDTQGVFLALSQILSKGKVQAEELRGQLGERLPGAFAMAAKAMGVTEQELNKMLEKGEVVASDFLPKFAKQLNETFGESTSGKVVSLQGSVNRFDNSLTKITSNAQLKEFLIDTVDGVTSLTDAFGDLIDTKPAEELEKEKISFMALRYELESSNTTVERRIAIITELKNTYPAYLAQINAEKVSNQELLPILDKINEAYVTRLAYQQRADRSKDIMQKGADLDNEQFDEFKKTRENIAKIQNELDKKGIKITIKGKDELEQANYVVKDLFKDLSKINSEMIKSTGKGFFKDVDMSFIRRMTGQVNRNRQNLENYSVEIKKTLEDLSIANKDLNEYASKKKMFDGSNNDAVTQQYNRTNTLETIAKSKISTKDKKGYITRLEAAGYSDEEQYQVLQEIMQKERASATVISDEKGKTAKQLAAEAKKRFDEALKLIAEQEQLELLTLQNAYAQRSEYNNTIIDSEDKFESERLKIRRKSLEERQKLLDTSEDKSRIAESKQITQQLKALEIEYAAWKLKFEEQQLQSRYEIELASLDQIYYSGQILETEYQKKRTDILIAELERRALLEKDAVKKAQLQTQIAQTRKEGAEKYTSVRGEVVLKTDADKDFSLKQTAIEKRFELMQARLNTREIKGEDIAVQRLILEAQKLQELRTIYTDYGKDVTDLNQQVALNIIASDNEKTKRQLENIERVKSTMMQSVEVIADYLGEGWGNLFTTLTEQMFDFVKKGKIQFKDLGEAVQFYGEMANSVGNILFQSQVDQSQKRIETLEAEKARVIEIETAGIENEKERAAVKARIEEEYNAKIREEKKRQAIAERNHALFQIAINTAVGVTQAFAQTGIGGFVLGGIILAAGLAQAALVMSKPLAYWTGTRSSEEGIADVAERGPELVKDSSSGKISYYKKRTRIFIPKGSQVLNAVQTEKVMEKIKLDQYEQSNRDISVLVRDHKRSNDINIMSEAFKAIKIDEEKIGDAVGRRISELPFTNWEVNENGFTKSIRRKNSKVKLLNNRNSLR
ncbi:MULTISPECIES: tape measure protein [unclassified Sphingobacterium]|uniref:tape measure protein n=1 Tax=unclassified Sphingobacterium TaxID=2609468 RepID=UPI0025D4A4A1|nr:MULTISPECIES: tape measure protein [unclassified Sphingobacterium]